MPEGELHRVSDARCSPDAHPLIGNIPIAAQRSAGDTFREAGAIVPLNQTDAVRHRAAGPDLAVHCLSRGIAVKTWVLVSNAYMARLFEYRARNEPWQEIATWRNPRDRLQRQDLVTDRPGGIASTANAQRSAFAPHYDPKDEVDRAFAAKLVQTMVSALDANTFDSLVLVAPPHFLGILRQAAPKRLVDVCCREVHKDLTREEVASLQRHVSRLIETA